VDAIALTAYSVEHTLDYGTRTESGHALTVHAASEREAVEAAEELAGAAPGVEHVTVDAVRRAAG
jgi:hypothetical protein